MRYVLKLFVLLESLLCLPGAQKRAGPYKCRLPA